MESAGQRPPAMASLCLGDSNNSRTSWSCTFCCPVMVSSPCKSLRVSLGWSLLLTTTTAHLWQQQARCRAHRPLPHRPLPTAHCPLPTAHCPPPTAHCAPSTASVSTPSTAHLVQLNVPSALALRRDLGGRVPTRAAAAAPRGERNSVRMPRRRRRSSSSTCCAPANAAATSTSRDASSLHAQMVRRTTAARRRQRGGVSVPQYRARPSAVVIGSGTSSSISTAITHEPLPGAAWNDQGSRRSQDGTHGSSRCHKGKVKVGHDQCAAATSRGRA